MLNNTNLYRYPQVEYFDVSKFNEYYKQRGVYNQFIEMKQKYDPLNLFNPLLI